VSFLSPAEGADHPLASQLFGIKGVASVLLLGDFVTINKDAGADWKAIADRAKEILQKTP